MKIIMQKWGEDIFKLTIWNEDLHLDNKDNDVTVINFATSKNLVVKSLMFSHQNIHKHICTSPDGKIHNQVDHILTDRRWHSSILGVHSFRGTHCDTDHNLVIAKVWERLAVSKKAAQKFDVVEFNLKKLSVLELRKPQIKISIRFALKNLNDSKDRNRAWESINVCIMEQYW